MSDRTVTEVAAELACAPKTVRKLIQAGALAAFRVGREWRITPTAIDRYRARTTYCPPAAPAPRPVRRPRATAARRAAWTTFLQ